MNKKHQKVRNAVITTFEPLGSGINTNIKFSRCKNAFKWIHVIQNQ
jgi:hypothetical protein